MNLEELKEQFIAIYGGKTDDIHFYFAPGRVNLIGEHTDYNNGFVFPCALSFGTYLLIRKVSQPTLSFHSTNFQFHAELPVAYKYQKTGPEWINYPLGVAEIFNQEGLHTGGLQMLYSGNIPPAAGLSSSASIEMVTAFALNDLYGWGKSVMDLIHLSRKAENTFIGVNCGIMDQFAVGQGKKGHAIFLNCGTLAFQAVPADLPGYRLVITNTNKKRGLADSKYNERVAECTKALEYLSRELDIKSLGELGLDQFLQHKDLIPDATVLKRAMHVVSENHRVLASVKALMNGDLVLFGKLMDESHDSLRDDYEVTGFELDTLVETMQKQDGVLGARMTGAGFGGCTVAFVKDENLDNFMQEVSKEYLAKTGLKADFYLPEISDGVRQMEV
jgi:galactokinase